MSKVTDLMADEVIDYCANEDCGGEIRFGQPAWKIDFELVCSSSCLLKKLGVVTVIAGKEVNQNNEQEVKSPDLWEPAAVDRDNEIFTASGDLPPAVR